MKVVFSAQAETDLGDILAHVAANYPGTYDRFESRLRAILLQIARWPEAAQKLENRAGVRVVPMLRYPYNFYYSVSDDTVEIIHVLHGARQAPPLGPI